MTRLVDQNYDPGDHMEFFLMMPKHLKGSILHLRDHLLVQRDSYLSSPSSAYFLGHRQISLNGFIMEMTETVHR